MGEIGREPPRGLPHWGCVHLEAVVALRDLDDLVPGLAFVLAA